MSTKDSSNEIAIKVEHVGKTFEPQSSSHTIKEGFVGLGRKLTGKKPSRHHKGEYTALKDISFEVKKGEFFGIVGRNGSGKSTLLKIIAGVYAPTKGTIQTNGLLTPFIELGVGFNPELSGRDNVFLNGALLGFTRHQMEEMYDDIVDFAELHDFMDTKLKNYSSGMQVRLAFSVAIRANSDILLIDEVLAVGDEAFQHKCFAYFDRLKRDKKTVVLVTHDMRSVKRFCDTSLFINSGYIEKIGSSAEIADTYSRQNDESYLKSVTTDNNNKAAISIDNRATLTVVNSKDKVTKSFHEDEEMTVKIAWDYDDVQHIGVAIIDTQGRDIFSTNTFLEGRAGVTKKNIMYRVRLNLAPGSYDVKFALFGKHDKDIKHRSNKENRIIVKSKYGNSYPYVGVTRLMHKWIER